MFNLDQAFALRDEDEEVYLDFQSFYFLMKCVTGVKKAGVTKYGALTFDEFKKMVEENKFFGGLKNYMTASFIMNTD